METRLTDVVDLEKMILFYERVSDQMDHTRCESGWKTNDMPTREQLILSIERKEIFVLEADGEYAAAMILNHECDSRYRCGKWNCDAGKEEVTVVHALCTLPEYQKKGLAKQLLWDAIRICRNRNQKSLRADARADNKAAHRLYHALGFDYISTMKVPCGACGEIPFDLYEYIL